MFSQGTKHSDLTNKNGDLESVYDGFSWFIQCEAPKIAKLVYNSNNYGLWYANNYSYWGL